MKTAERFLHSAERNLEIEENEMAEIASRALWEAFFCLGVCLGIVVIFRERFNSGGRLARFMADNSFAVYFFHPVILILVTASFRGFALHPLAKFAVAAAVAVPICFLASGLVLRRIPVVRRVL